MVKTIKKLVNDTLKSPSGKYSRKSLTIFVSFSISILIGVYIVFSHLFSDTPISEYSIDVFQTFMLFVATMSGIATWDKQKVNKEIKENDE